MDKTSRILVTGADGFIGSHLVELLVKAGYKVRAFCIYNSIGSWGWLDSLSVDIKENFEPLNTDEEMKTNVEMPPQRDIRDTQPTISVNYRVVKNTEENKFKMDKNYSNSFDNDDDWDDEENDW